MQRKIPASRHDEKSVMSAGSLRMISRSVNSGTISSHGVILNVARNDAENSAICAGSLISCVNPTIVKTTSAMVNDGTVVIIIYRIWVKSGVSADDEANTVVSDSGETLSPKYAPEIIAPAIQPSSKPCA